MVPAEEMVLAQVLPFSMVKQVSARGLRLSQQVCPAWRCLVFSPPCKRTRPLSPPLPRESTVESLFDDPVNFSGARNAKDGMTHRIERPIGTSFG